MRLHKLVFPPLLTHRCANASTAALDYQQSGFYPTTNVNYLSCRHWNIGRFILQNIVVTSSHRIPQNPQLRSYQEVWKFTPPSCIPRKSITMAMQISLSGRGKHCVCAAVWPRLEIRICSLIQLPESGRRSTSNLLLPLTYQDSPKGAAGLQFTQMNLIKSLLVTMGIQNLGDRWYIHSGGLDSVSLLLPLITLAIKRCFPPPRVGAYFSQRKHAPELLSAGYPVEADAFSRNARTDPFIIIVFCTMSFLLLICRPGFVRRGDFPQKVRRATPILDIVVPWATNNGEWTWVHH